VAFGCILFCLVLIAQFLESPGTTKK